MNYKSLPNQKQTLDCSEESIDNDNKIEYNLQLLNAALAYLENYHDTIEEAEEHEQYEESIKQCLTDIYYAITSGKQEILDFIESYQVNELIIDFFSSAKIFVENHSHYSYGLLQCINGIIRNYPNDSNPSLTQVIFHQFQMLEPNSINRDDEIKYLSLFFDTLRQICHDFDTSYFDETFFQHLLSFQGIDNEIDSQIVLIFNYLYLTLPEYPSFLIQCTKIIFQNASFHIYFNCAQLFNTVSNKIPDFFADPQLINVFNTIFIKSKDRCQLRTCTLLLDSLISVPYSTSCHYIDNSIKGFIADSIVQSATIYVSVQQESFENSEMVSIQLLNYLLENDGDTYINIFFNQEEYDLLDHLISIMENQAFSIREIACSTFLFFTKTIVQTENNSIFMRFVESSKFPNQFATLITLSLNIDDITLRNSLIDCIILFLQKVRVISEEEKFLKAFDEFDFIQTVINDDELDKDLIGVLTEQFYPNLNEN